MKKKFFAIGIALIVLISGGVYCMTKWIEHQNSPYNVSDVLDDKGVKLYKRGFRLLEEQLATYIKEHYSGVSRVFTNFCPRWGWAEHVSGNNCACHL